jgi:hypothetical protein
MKTLITRMIRASSLDAQTYELVEADRGSTGPAIFVAVLASIAAALGSGVQDIIGLIGLTAMLLLSWIIWVGLTYVIGTRLFAQPQTHADIGELLRTTGFSASPGVLRILGFIPGLGLPIFIVITVWMLVTFVVAVRQALDYSGSGRALAVCVLGWLIHGIVFFAFVRTAV